MKNYLNKYLKTQTELIKKVNFENLIGVTKLVNQVRTNNKKIIVIGNGGSAAIASHASVDFTKVGRVRCINFNEASLLTCFSNDYQYENWASKAIEFYSDPDDLVILISSSGKSKNIINAAKKAKKLKCHLVTFTGFSKNNEVSKYGKYNFWVNSKIYNFIENVHQVWILSIVDNLVKTKL